MLNLCIFVIESTLLIGNNFFKYLRQGIKYGTTAAGTSFAFFRVCKSFKKCLSTEQLSLNQDSTIEPYQKMGAYMTANSDTVLTSDTTEGVERVRRDEDYAFIMESPLARYVIM